MKGKLIVICLALFVFSCGPKEKETLYPDGQTKERFEFTVGENGSELKNGAYTLFHSNGQVKEKGNYEQNEKNGTWKEFDMKGNLIREYVVLEGSFQGDDIRYNANGDTVQLRKYDKGELHQLIQWDKKGNVYKDIELRGGKNISIIGKWDMDGIPYDFKENGTLVMDRSMGRVKDKYRADANEVVLLGKPHKILSFTEDSFELEVKSMFNPMTIKFKKIRK